MFNQVINLMHNVKDYLDQSFVKEFAFELRDICFDQSKNKIGEEALRSIEKKDLTAFTHGLESLLNSLVSGKEETCQEVYQYTEQIELELALKCLKIPILEMKFIGHSILSSKINQVKLKREESNKEQDRGHQGGHISTL